MKIELKPKEPIGNKYPITFHDMICVKCGNDNLDFYDIFGNRCRNEIHPYSHLLCPRCGEIYDIAWDPTTGNYDPYPVERKNAVNEILNRNFQKIKN